MLAYLEPLAQHSLLLWVCGALQCKKGGAACQGVLPPGTTAGVGGCGQGSDTALEGQILTLSAGLRAGVLEAQPMLATSLCPTNPLYSCL